MLKYINTTDNTNQHWKYCQANKLPYITIKDCGNNYSEIFVDITYLKIPLEDISIKLKEYYLSYLEFLLLEGKVFDYYKDQYYYFSFLVKTEHSYTLSSHLFDYIKEQWIK